MKLMWWDKILLIMTWGKTEEKPNALILWETIYKYTLSRRCSLENWNLCLRDIWPLNLTMHIQGLSNLELLKKLLVMYVWLDRRKDKYTHTQACLLIPLRISRKICLLYQGRETIYILRNKTKRQKLFVPEPYTYIICMHNSIA